MNYVLHILILIGIYSMLGMSLNLLAGYSGLLSICHAAFYGLGAYVTALLTLKLQLPWLATVPASAVFTGFFAWAIGKIALRFRDDLFVIATRRARRGPGQLVRHCNLLFSGHHLWPYAELVRSYTGSHGVAGNSTAFNC